VAVLCPLIFYIAMIVITWVVIGGIAFLIAFVDMLLWISEGYKATISGQLYLVSRRWPFVPILVSFGFGLACGHFFLPPPCLNNSPSLEISTGKNNDKQESVGMANR
jgi:hypothetical protein